MLSEAKPRQRAKQAARALLRRGGVAVPVDVEAIARADNISVRLQGLEDEVSGMLVVRSAGAVIGVNANHHPHRRRFTIAHELGHYLLHRDQANFFIDAAPVFFRSEGSSATTRVQEQEANTFAAELLMPERAVREAVRDDPIDVFDDVAIRRLGDRFGVSAQALLIRLTELDLTFG